MLGPSQPVFWRVPLLTQAKSDSPRSINELFNHSWSQSNRVLCDFARCDFDGSLLAFLALCRWFTSSLGGCCSLLCALSDELDSLLDGLASLLPVDHYLEALEVGEVSSEASLGKLLGDGGLSPLRREIGLLCSPDKGSGTGATLKGNLHPGQ